MPMTTRRRLLGAAAGTGAVVALPQWVHAADDDIPDVLNGRRWDPAAGLMLERVGGIGYHTTLPSGQWVHPTRSNLDYALRLLNASQSPASVARASEVIAKVLTYQDTDPNSPTFGVWPWYTEESLAQMSPPDPNWADFNGARLTEALLDHGALLAPDLVAAMKRAIHNACESIVRRNSGPGYTNIAMMGARVTLAGGEILGEPRFVDYGRAGLKTLLDYTNDQGSFNEYNSPTYTTVGLQELEAVLGYVRDAPARTSAEALRQIAWALIADHWHPGTLEWAGPHARAYTDRLAKDIRTQLAMRVGLPLGLPTVPEMAGKAVPCPPALKSRFAALPQPRTLVRTRFIRYADDSQSVYGTTWFVADATLGSANIETFWTQRHPLIGFWKTSGEVPAVLRVRCLKDGRDFSSMGIRTVQKDGRVLFGVYPVAGAGDWHITLDKPKDGLFHGKALRVRISLDGKGAAVHQIGDAHYELTCGGWKAVVHTGDSRFDGKTTGWQIVTDGDLVAVDYVIPLSAPFAVADLKPSLVTAGLAVMPVAQAAALDVVQVSAANGAMRTLSWGDLTLNAPEHAPPPGHRVS